ncbi:cofactor assembly of complex C subunit B [Baaleninema sp.]|uniref:cofactor assembly of complex C subunit B n=1 Tax=Baaleninema sp. TaxID=3101197 RepID=UPI003D082CC3
MSNSIAVSIAIPTLLLAVGLVFFIRAASKDRTEEVRLASDRSPEDLSSSLKTHFTQRAYRPVDFQPDTKQVVFEGQVRASWFLAVFLSLLAAIGLLCVALVFSTLFPKISGLAPLIVVGYPIAGWLYWQSANRRETVAVKVEAAPDGNAAEGSRATVIAHRDELIALQQALPDLRNAEAIAESK